MQKHDEWLCERLPEWEAEGLVDPASAERLRIRYGDGAKSSAGGGRLAMGILSGFGALLVGLGVIALFAANWGAMSRGQRAGVSMLPLTITTVLAMVGFARDWKAHAFWEALGICWTLAIWSGFGLVCQTYHLSDDVHGFILACTLLCLPVLYLTKSAVATVVWPLYGLVWFVGKEVDFHTIHFPWCALAYLAMLAAHLPVFVMVRRRILFRGLYDFFGVGFIAAGVVALISMSPLYLGHKVWLMFPALIWTGLALWLVSEWLQWRSVRILGFLYLLPVILVMPADSNFLYFLIDDLFNLWGLMFLIVLTILAWTAGVFLLVRKDEKRLPREKWPLAIAMLVGLPAGMFAVLLGLPWIICFLVILIIAALFLANALRNLRLLQMNISLCVLIYEILGKYLSSDWSFTAKGLLLLVCGFALLASNVFIIRRRSNRSADDAARKPPSGTAGPLAETSGVDA